MNIIKIRTLKAQPLPYCYGNEQAAISAQMASRLIAALELTATALPTPGFERKLIRNVSVRHRPSLYLLNHEGRFHLYSPGVATKDWPTVFGVMVPTAFHRPARLAHLPTQLMNAPA